MWHFYIDLMSKHFTSRTHCDCATKSNKMSILKIVIPNSQYTATSTASSNKLLLLKKKYVRGNDRLAPSATFQAVITEYCLLAQ